MPFEKKYRDEGEQDFTLEGQPKRSSYKKINQRLRRRLFVLAVKEGISIAELSKRYRINYSTISYIIRAFKECALLPSPSDLPPKQEMASQLEYQPEKCEDKAGDCLHKIVKEEERQLTESTLEASFEDGKKKISFWWMIRPFQMGGEGGQAGDGQLFPFYPFANYEGV